MTECITEVLQFGRLSRRQVVADFRGGRLTSDAGVLLLREVDRRLGLLNAVTDCLADPRVPEKITHAQRTMLAQRIFGIALGYEDLNDHHTLRRDPALQTASQESPLAEDQLASPSTLCRMENRVTRQSLFDLSAILVEQFLASYDSAPEEIVLDLDATDDPTHGNQEGRFFHGYYRHYCFLPLYIFCGEQILCAYLRPSNIDVAKHSRAIVRLLVQRIRRQWPKTRIVLRADSGFCRWRLMRWCEKHDISYIFGIARNAVLERLITPLMEEAEQRFEVTGDKQRLFAETLYAAATWDHPRRVVMKAESLLRGTNPRFIVTNLRGNPQQLYDQLYAPRGDMENRIKEQQLMLFSDRTSCHDFQANQFRLLLSSFAYVLVQGLRRIALSGTELAKAQVHTIRLKLFKIAARVQVSVRRVLFHLSTSYPYQTLFRQISRALLRPG